MQTAQQLIYSAAGNPDGKYQQHPWIGTCAACAAGITDGTPTTEIVGDAFSRQSEFIRFSDHVCAACAWLFGAPKKTHRNVIAAQGLIWWPMVSHTSATDERPCWLDVLRIIARMPAETVIAAVMTVDPKPRLWPMTEIARRDNFGAYFHWPDYDVSEYRTFNLDETLTICGSAIIPALKAGYSKKACYFGLLSDLKRAKKDLSKTMAMEKELSIHRDSRAFLPALMASGK